MPIEMYRHLSAMVACDELDTIALSVRDFFLKCQYHFHY